jgi:hypothetical protein
MLRRSAMPAVAESIMLRGAWDMAAAVVKTRMPLPPTCHCQGLCALRLRQRLHIGEVLPHILS